MNILILGAGSTGVELARLLSVENHNIVLVDKSDEKLKIVNNTLDIKTVIGHTTDINILQEAGIKNADILISVTDVDELNITACQIAKKIYKTKITIASVSNATYYQSDIAKSILNDIDFAISKNIETSKIIKRILSISGARDVVSFLDGNIKAIGVTCNKNAPLAGVKIKFISAIDKENKLAIIYIKRKNFQGIIPGKSDEILAGDEVYFICDANDIEYAMSLFGYVNDTKNNLLVIGGEELCSDIIDDNILQTANIKFIEQNLHGTKHLNELQNIEFIQGHMLDVDLLINSGIRDTDLMLALTNDDKTNITLCQLSKKLGCKRTSALLNDFSNLKLFQAFEINSILNANNIITSKIVHFIKSNDSESILSFDNDEIELFLMEVDKNSHAVGILIEDIISENEVYVAAIARDNQVIIMPKLQVLRTGDNVVFISNKNSKQKITELFKIPPRYLI